MSYAYFNDTRNRLFDQQLGRGLPPFGQMRYSATSIFTESQPQSKSYMHSFGDENILNSIHKLSNPLKKNLADTLAHTAGTMTADNVPKMAEVNKNKRETAPNMPMDSQNRRVNTYFGITSFFSGIMNVLSGNIFNKRAKSPPSYRECCDYESESETLSSVGAWRLANCADQNKNERAHDWTDSPSGENTKQPANMTEECHAAAEQCQDKINKVRQMLSKKTLSSPKKCQPRRLKKVFVEPNSIENSFQEDFLSDYIEPLPNMAQTEFSSPCVVQKQELLQTDSPITKTVMMPVQEKIEIVKTLDDTAKPIDNLATLANTTMINTNAVEKNSADSLPESVKEVKMRSPKCKPRITPVHRPKDKHYKNPHRLSCAKRSQSQVKRQIEEDMHFADEIDSDNLSYSSSIENVAPIGMPASSSSDHQTDDSDVFDEIEGRFHSKLDCKDSFQIVFTDIPKFRTRKPSDCESEDSFIVFEGSPNDCYATDDVFVEEDEDSDETSDEESEDEESDDEASFGASMSQLSRSVGDLTDESLYEAKSEDQVDCAARFDVPEIDSSIISEADIESSGVLLTDAKKRFKKNLPPKKVQFSPHPPQVRVMRVWAFAAGRARIGHWEQCGRDRERFKRRIADVDMAVSWVLKPQHRSRVMFQRFMPWWNQQKRRELADKKRDEEERRCEIEKQQAIAESAAVNENVGDCIQGVEDKNIEENCLINGKINKTNGTRVGNDDGVLMESIEHGRELEKATLHNEANSSADDVKVKVCESILGANETVFKRANLNGVIDKVRDKELTPLLGHDTANLDDGNASVNNNCVSESTLGNSNDIEKVHETKKDINNTHGKLCIVEYKSADTDKNGLKSINKALINSNLGLKASNKVVI